jgi:CRP-like cAMP-binding protein
MSKKNIQNTPSTNRLLAVLPSADLTSLLSKTITTKMSFGKIIYEPGDEIQDVFFPNSGIISLLSTIGSRSMLEIGIVGKEGMVGLPVYLGVNKSTNRAIVQGNGVFLKLKTSLFLEECEKSKVLSQILRRYTHSLLTQISQSAVCNRFHLVNERLARWLLMTRDRMEMEEFKLTQEFLSNMLGVRREAVTIAAQGLQEKQLIRYTRGNIKILDGPGLETISCVCYKTIKSEEEKLFS